MVTSTLCSNPVQAWIFQLFSCCCWNSITKTMITLQFFTSEKVHNQVISHSNTLIPVANQGKSTAHFRVIHLLPMQSVASVFIPQNIWWSIGTLFIYFWTLPVINLTDHICPSFPLKPSNPLLVLVWENHIFCGGGMIVSIYIAVSVNWLKFVTTEQIKLNTPG